MDNRQLPPTYHRNVPDACSPRMGTQRAGATTPTANQAAVQSGLWMRAGFVGASVFATGLVSLLSDGGQATGLTPALAAIAAGAAIAWFAWRNVTILLRRIDAAEATAATSAAATGADALTAGIGAGRNTAALAAR